MGWSASEDDPVTSVRKKAARVVIVGGGFAGLYAALTVRKDESELAEVTLIDQRNYFTFTPLLPEVAAATLGPAHVSYPFRLLARKAGSSSTTRWIRLNFACSSSTGPIESSCTSIARLPRPGRTSSPGAGSNSDSTPG